MANFCYYLLILYDQLRTGRFDVRTPIETRYFLFSRPGQTVPADQLASYTMGTMSRVVRAWF
jgi:hypothetical protein